MDLLQGYGSSDSDNDSVSSNLQPAPQYQSATAKPAAAKLSTSTTNRGKRILSLGAVLPPEIFDRLTRPADADDSSTSSFEGGDDNRAGSKKRKRTKNGDDSVTSSKPSNNSRGGVDRTELNSFLSELRSAPMEKKDGNDANSKNKSQNNKSEKLGMAFMSFTESKHNSKEVVDVHAAKPSAPRPRPTARNDSNSQRKSAAPSLSFSRISTAAPVANNVPMPQYSSTSNYNNIPAYHVPQETQQQMNAPIHSNNTTTKDDYNAKNTMTKSRKQRREEERALRSGAAFQNPSAATELHQPSPTEFAPTAHAAAIASRAARFRGAGGGGGGGGSVKNISMYDPKEGSDVAGQGVTGKHRSKHQINSLMANAISLEAHRAAESELARIGGGQKGGSSRADAKRKYGW
eukprot:scaffold2557_cov139-Skeletonema_marinoi.AAC.15